MAIVARKIVHIDEDACNGCGICARACHEGAIQMVNGKAKLVSESYCDGLGDCLGPCPTGAISIVTREAEDYDAVATAKHIEEKKNQAQQPGPLPCGCPGSMSRELKPAAGGCPGSMSRALNASGTASTDCACAKDAPEASELMNWPLQLKLAPPTAPYLQGAHILLAADCAGFAAPALHRRYLRDRPVIIACPKLEENAPQAAKLGAIIAAARPAAITVLRMEVPCCGGLVRIAHEAVKAAGIDVPITTIILGIDGTEKNA